jgi:mono/diheme cytochrome c family protein
MKRVSLSNCLLVISLVVCSQAAQAAEEVSSMARGGLLYDKWYAVVDAKTEGTHPAWPASNQKKSGSTTHRCKSCHGWDLLGKDGAYASGSYKTGIGGLRHLSGASNASVIAALKAPMHGYAGKMSDRDFTDLANFVTRGQVDMSKIIDSGSRKAKGGNVDRGAAYYNTVCAGCHAENGKEPDDMPPLGQLSNKNPWEVIHKIQNGQPDEPMPAMRAFDLQVTTDLLSYLQTLPQK